MGYSMRTASYRYTEWASFICGKYLLDPLNCTESSAPDWNNVWGIELVRLRRPCSFPLVRFAFTPWFFCRPSCAAGPVPCAL